MPFIQVHLKTGRTPKMKETLAGRIARAFEEEKLCPREAVSVVFHDVEETDWVVGGNPTPAEPEAR